ncbi:MAG: DNA-binding protein [Desulfobaccales bacterium]
MRIIKSLLVIGLCLAFAGPALAQPGGGQGMMGGTGKDRGMGPGGGRGMMYNLQTVTTIQGTVESLGPKGPRMQHESRIIKTDQGSIMVHLGPTSYINQQQIQLNPGDCVEVTGSKVEMRGRTMLLAKEVKVGGKTLRLRDDQGLPLWRGQGRPQPQ